MKIADVPGQGTDANHKEWILVESMSWPIYRKVDPGAVDVGRVQSNTVIGDMVTTRSIDKSSPKMMQFCANGKPIKEVLIHKTTQSDQEQKTYLEIKLENVFITSYSLHEVSESRGSEENSFAFTKFEVTYNTLDPKDAAGKGKVVTAYDLGAGK
jgi:type VI secretion system secreted protein Hcp